jgi:hypothetical protein
MMMPKEKIFSLERDKNSDEQNLSAAMNEVSDARKIAARVGSELTNKYGLEFGGWIRLEYHVLENSFALKCANGEGFAFEAHELPDLPSKLMFMRKQHLGKKLKEEKEKNEADFTIHSI